jgi:cytosolic carboxypeptidase protein 2/3
VYDGEFDPRPVNYRNMQTLEFKVGLKPDTWTYVAYCPPYTFARLSQFLDSLDLENRKDRVFKDVLCKSESGVELPCLHITNFSFEEEKEHSAVKNLILSKKKRQEYIVPHKQRPIIVLTARVHPGETCSSHMMHGMIDFLLSNDIKAKLLRDIFEFVVVPMLNPDGVILGNFRTGLAGDDLNR